jgi:hypothetical protein
MAREVAQENVAALDRALDADDMPRLGALEPAGDRYADMAMGGPTARSSRAANDGAPG